MVTDYQPVLDVLGTEPMTTKEVSEQSGLSKEATLMRLHAANADGLVELILASHGYYRWLLRA